MIEHIEAYLLTYRGRLKPSTFQDYASILRGHLANFSNFDELNRTLEQYLVELEVSPKRRNNIITAAKSFLNWAIRRKLWEGHLYAIPRFRGRSKKPLPLKPNEARLVMEYTRMPYRTFFQLSILTGLRTGEALGLRFEDFDFDNNLLHVRRAITCGHVVDPKTKSGERSLPLFRALREIYQSRKADNLGGSPWFFYADRGKLFSRSTLRKIWKGVLYAFEIEARPMYATRHTFASLALAAGEDPLWISRMMGHSRPDQLLLRYATYMEGVKNDGSKLTEIIYGKSSLMRALPGKNGLP